MPNWGDEDGCFWWVPDDEPWYNSIEIPHPPVGDPHKGCDCDYCEYGRRKNIPRKHEGSKRKSRTDGNNS